MTGSFGFHLIKWYRLHGRDLPWRHTRDPYLIWISEVMLQQTQVATVIPYYHRFLARYPTLSDLAQAPLSDLLKLWEGLGYYARCRHLHEAAGEVMKRFGGQIPTAVEGLLSLPGIGRSTAHAIATIAFGQCHPILDGNVRRVLCRYFAVQKNPREKAVEKQLWDYSEQLLPYRHANFYTQGLMDLGATVCTPTQPRCPICPVQKGCAAFRQGLQMEIPVKTIRKKIPHYPYLAGVIWYRQQVLIHRRSPKGLLGGLWEFPGGRVEETEKSFDLQFADLLKEVIGCEIKPVRKFRPWWILRHTFTHFKMTLHVVEGEIKGVKRIPFSDWKWTGVDQLALYPFSATHKKIAIALSKRSD